MKTNFFAYRRWRPAPYVAVIVWLALGPIARAGVADAVKYAKLPNGLQVIVLENHKAPVATLNVFYRVGSRNEVTGKTGISHLCEHLMFRGTK
jgi:zinc protease